jgi:flagellar biosynthetic protein FlhB
VSEGGDDEAEKSFEPTQKRLDEARKRGEMPRSTDLVTAAAYAGMWGALAGFGAGALLSLGDLFAALLGQASTLADATFGGDPRPLWGGVLAGTATAAWPLVVVPALLTLLVSLAQGVVVAPERLRPKGSKVNPLAAFGRKFGPAGLGEFAMAFAKLALFAAVLGHGLWAGVPRLLAMTGRDPGLATSETLDLAMDLLWRAVLVAVAIGLADLVWQRLSFLRRHMMSRKEMTDEMKESEGDPHIKGQRRSRAVAIATNRMLADVDAADVVVVNPTHYAVALKWDRVRGGAPRCVAKGVDEVAARIRERATLAGVPIHRDPPTARALHATLEIGDEVARADWRAVAAAIRFADKMRARARARTGAKTGARTGAKQ